MKQGDETVMTGCERLLTKEWAGPVHELMIELCGRCTCEDEQVIQTLWVERPALRLIVAAA